MFHKVNVLVFIRQKCHRQVLHSQIIIDNMLNNQLFIKSFALLCIMLMYRFANTNIFSHPKYWLE